MADDVTLDRRADTRSWVPFLSVAGGFWVQWRTDAIAARRRRSGQHKSAAFQGSGLQGSQLPHPITLSFTLFIRRDHVARARDHISHVHQAVCRDRILHY